LNITIGFVEKSHFFAEDAKRPPIRYEAVECQHQNMLILVKRDQRDPEQWPRPEIKRLAGLCS
jgi:hypothetical protein